MKTQRNIGKEILAGLKEIQAWQYGKKELKVTSLSMSEVNSTVKGQQNKSKAFSLVRKKPTVSCRKDS